MLPRPGSAAAAPFGQEDTRALQGGGGGGKEGIDWGLTDGRNGTVLIL